MSKPVPNVTQASEHELQMRAPLESRRVRFTEAPNLVVIWRQPRLARGSSNTEWNRLPYRYVVLLVCRSCIPSACFHGELALPSCVRK